MNITIVTGPWLPVPAIQGGAVNRLWQGLAEEFATKGHNVRILCREYLNQPNAEIINNVEYIRKGGFSQGRSILFDLVKDLVYATSIFSSLPLADILIINDFWMPIFAPLRPKCGKIIINAARVPKRQYFLYANAHRYSAVSHAIKKAILQQYPAAIKKTKVINNPVDTYNFYPIATPQHHREFKTILYAGRLHPEKGISLLIDAFLLVLKQVRNIRLKIIGPFRDNQGGGGDVYFEKLKLKSKGLLIEFLPPIFNSKELANVYQESDLFCYPSLAEKGEAFGVAPLEAMACGLLPIVSNLDCFKDFIEDGKTGYIFDHRNSNPSEQLASVLLKALSDWDKSKKIAHCAAEKARKFSYEEIASQYLRDFESLLKDTNEVPV